MIAISKDEKSPVVAVETEKIDSIKGKQIGILGGTFNPVHLGHLLVAQQVVTKLHLDEIWFIPTNIPPLKDAPKVSPEDRANMLELATHDNPQFYVKLFELFRGGVSYTVDTLRHLHNIQPQNHYYLIIGSDQVNNLKSWKEPTKIAQLATLVGVQRPGYPQKAALPIIWVDVPKVEISSTLIRQTIAMGGSIKYLVPEAVENYLYQKRLYND
ncbi:MULTISPECIES: nicotinate-nucleotide adenylyltransferase [unclassified Lactobacillus]|uniref:nicotinate-nucleotide adenylyltransferase n=1 Tax=unclassified Lactobacillus TaxID=2620435 RepID=UPI000EFA9AC0|nr:MULTISPECIES: nicotinate-nucleotide adenylyltransferase [unclassified Lactobacillus]RMC24191.1 nicotinate-nucleotide adenylyltransferase [Lactobacillus sp. ESL0247]RMC28764.1 nicotinate-nucleotide adenylyltransferase [Lactobacillus sp. ESL0246]RMC31421.1 nicotinate-nucleotide adenylyltransferase [Lactobacillus sp. ESL0245]RMC49087.1 nicotinate-nucleotide adenylyltransferase [Lactobacillus sp. ESL0228]